MVQRDQRYADASIGYVSDKKTHRRTQRSGFGMKVPLGRCSVTNMQTHIGHIWLSAEYVPEGGLLILHQYGAS